MAQYIRIAPNTGGRVQVPEGRKYEPPDFLSTITEMRQRLLHTQKHQGDDSEEPTADKAIRQSWKDSNKRCYGYENVSKRFSVIVNFKQIFFSER